MERRQFIKQSSFAAGALLISQSTEQTGFCASDLHISTNSYSWSVFYNRENKDFNAISDDVFPQFPVIGLHGYEPGITSPADIRSNAALLKKHNLEMRSIYVNSLLHDQEEAQKSITNIIKIATEARNVGTKIIVTNPNPIQWGVQTNAKNGEQLQIQANALNQLGKQLKAIGITLAYHNHDMELLHAARELHHMMLGTNPEYVTFCFDSHWIYRGSGNSNLAMFDILQLYGTRISELHLRQSRDHVWSETFGEGDIDYVRFANEIKKLGIKPHLVLEQAVEKGTPHTMTPIEAHRISSAYVTKLFG
jgi:inosose dehydratase